MSNSVKEIRDQLFNKVERLKWNFQKTKDEYEEQIKKYENALQALNELVADNDQTTLFIDDKKVSKTKDKTLRSKVIEIFKLYDTPLTSRDLMDLINNRYPAKQYEFNQFSAQFSTLYRRANSKIKKYEVENAPPNKSAFYYLEEWEAQDIKGIRKLQEDYIEKIYDRYGVK